MSPDYHVPVLLDAVVKAADGATRVVDATVGDGGHAEAFLAGGAELLAIDRDQSALDRASARLGRDRVTFLESPYSDNSALDAISRFGPDFILLDLGVSSAQLDQEGRGFTFRPGARLDMRMGANGATAADLLNSATEQELERIFRDFGDERRARALAREVLRRRGREAYRVSDDFVNAIRAVLGPRSGPGDFARLFQALRIAVNDELGGLARALPAMLESLVPGGSLAVISYHSGEDRLVKTLFREWERGCICPPRQPVCTCGRKPLGQARPHRGITASDTEIAGNPRARSARLRIFRKADADQG
jgi:16S rRNA (cytosine1402-N4)-methyltransferase